MSVSANLLAMTPSAEKLRLLLVIENEISRGVIETAAEASDMFGSIACAEDAHDALAQVWDYVQQESLPDVIVADMEMTGCNGIELTRELRRHDETRPVFIALVAESTNELGRASAETAGADCFGAYSTSVPEMTEVLREIARRSIAATRVAMF